MRTALLMVPWILGRLAFADATGGGGESSPPTAVLSVALAAAGGWFEQLLLLVGVESWFPAIAARVGLAPSATPAAAASACAAVLLVLFVVPCLPLRNGCRRRALDGQGPFGTRTPHRLRLFSRWAVQQIEESAPQNHRCILDDVISTFTPYAQRIGQDPSPSVRRAAAFRLRVLVELLEQPKVNQAFRDVNWEWVGAWERKELDPREARTRCTTVLPTVVAAARVQQQDMARQWLPRRMDEGAMHCNLSYLAAWCADFGGRPDVREVIGCSEGGGGPVAGVSFVSAGALYSDSEEEESGGEDVAREFSVPKSPKQGGGVEYQDFARRVHEGQEHCWDEPDVTSALVRGPRYLTDRLKVKSQPSMLQLVDVDLVKTNDEMPHYAGSSRSRIPQLRAKGDDRFFFVLNFRLPPLQLGVIWAVPPDADWAASPEGSLFRSYCHMTKEERNPRLKVLPRVLDGPWLVQMGVPDRPGVVGRKLAVDYFGDDTHLEVSLNCISSPAGRRLVQLLTGAARHFSMDLLVILEGQSENELPERVLGGVSLFRGDLAKISTR